MWRTSSTRTMAMMLASMCISSTDAFTTSTHKNNIATFIPSSLTKLNVKALGETETSSSSSSSSKDDDEILTKRAVTDEEIMDIASFRNDLTSPEMLIAKQQAKRDEIDTTADAVRGLSIGLGIGALYGAATFFDGGDVTESLTNFGVMGGTIGAILGINNAQGKAVYVASLPEAQNRLKVDYVEGLIKRQDIGFYGTITDKSFYNNRFEGCNGVVGCIDCQLRNCDGSENDKAYGALPPHVHIKNLSVDSAVRRKGVARRLVKMVEDYAREETEAELITLVVDDFNDAALNLYTGLGYTQESIGNPSATQKYGQWMRGRSAMYKIL
mmetsp:Transcript_23615/g.34821  ORF Transcript_23615/g.34821 Transcript_23615/m.34821 type:complete len:327 (-) Transcript_23615:199-1179(-)